MSIEWYSRWVTHDGKLWLGCSQALGLIFLLFTFLSLH